MSEQLRMSFTYPEPSAAAYRAAFERCPPNVRRYGFERAMATEAVKKCLAVMARGNGQTRGKETS